MDHVRTFVMKLVLETLCSSQEARCITFPKLASQTLMLNDNSCKILYNGRCTYLSDVSLWVYKSHLILNVSIQLLNWIITQRSQQKSRTCLSNV